MESDVVLRLAEKVVVAACSERDRSSSELYRATTAHEAALKRNEEAQTRVELAKHELMLALDKHLRASYETD